MMIENRDIVLQGKVFRSEWPIAARGDTWPPRLVIEFCLDDINLSALSVARRGVMVELRLLLPPPAEGEVDDGAH